MAAPEINLIRGALKTLGDRISKFSEIPFPISQNERP